MVKNNSQNVSLKDIDFRNIASLGKSYLEASRKCNVPDIECIGWVHYLFVPIITNMAFACELFLKAILQRDGNKVKGHRLVTLFEQLEDNVKKDIVGTEDMEIFIDKLTNISDLFVNYRYMYEDNISSINYNFLKIFPKD